VVELLVKEGADVSVSDRWGNKPLDDARCATKNSKEITKLLKANGAVSPSLFLPFASRAKKKGPGKTIPTMSSIGTIVYWPPEMFVEATTPKPSMDMWSAGGMFIAVSSFTSSSDLLPYLLQYISSLVIMYIVLTGSHPFDKEADKTDEEVQELLMKVGSAYKDGGNLELLNDVVFDERVSDLSPSSIDLMKKLLHPDPKKRLTSEEFLRHPWIQGITAKKLKMKDTHQKLLKRYTLV
jgi:serine/threonine protein kinase